MHLPLPERLRPSSFDEIIGQEHLIGKDGWLKKSAEQKTPFSILLYGPPGTGKTTIAKIYGKTFDFPFVQLSAVFSGIADLKKIISEGQKRPLFEKKIILFVDEIHRFNKAQQDAFLPYMEDGSLILIGATTENPSFSLNNALLSRLRVLRLYPLKEEELEQILKRFENKTHPLSLTLEARQHLIQQAYGDARYLLHMLENIEYLKDKTIDLETLFSLIQKKSTCYDRHGDYHHALISALHKAVRGSDPDAALYWLSRMLEGGEDPLYIARRMIRMAIEDIGLADPEALHIAHLGWQTYHMLGSPEGELALAQTVIYLALAPKSNSIYTAFSQARQIAEKTSHHPPPETILNAPTKLMEKWGYGKHYQYDHDDDDGFSGQNYFPKNLPRQHFYHPVLRGFEREMKKRLDYFSNLRKRKNPRDSQENPACDKSS